VRSWVFIATETMNPGEHPMDKTTIKQIVIVIAALFLYDQAKSRNIL
jgi:hypothetical protein